MVKEGYAVIPMKEYLNLYDRVATLDTDYVIAQNAIKAMEWQLNEKEKENAWLKEQIQQLKLELEECGDALQNSYICCPTCGSLIAGGD